MNIISSKGRAGARAARESERSEGSEFAFPPGGPPWGFAPSYLSFPGAGCESSGAMNLICPHCNTEVTLADSLAGQQANCPQCQGPFTVPYPPAPAPGTFGVREEPPPISGAVSPPPPSPGPAFSQLAPPPPVGGYTKQVSCRLNPQWLRWVAPACLGLIFLLMFFPWVGAYAGSKMLVRQSGVGVAFGGYSEYQKDWLQDSLLKGQDSKSVLGALALFYFLLIVVAALACAGLVALTVMRHPLVEQIAPFRAVALLGVSAFLLFLLVLQLLLGFPLENKATRAAEKSHKDSADKIEKTASSSREKEEGLVLAELMRETQKGWLQRRFWLKAVIFLNIVAVVAALGDLWLERRPGRPQPRMLIEW